MSNPATDPSDDDDQSATSSTDTILFPAIGGIDTSVFPATGATQAPALSQDPGPPQQDQETLDDNPEPLHVPILPLLEPPEAPADLDIMDGFYALGTCVGSSAALRDTFHGQGNRRVIYVGEGPFTGARAPLALSQHTWGPASGVQHVQGPFGLETLRNQMIRRHIRNPNPEIIWSHMCVDAASFADLARHCKETILGRLRELPKRFYIGATGNPGLRWRWHQRSGNRYTHMWVLARAGAGSIRAAETDLNDGFQITHPTYVLNCANTPEGPLQPDASGHLYLYVNWEL